jgi:hypothetical protein
MPAHIGMTDVLGGVGGFFAQAPGLNQVSNKGSLFASLHTTGKGREAKGSDGKFVSPADVGRLLEYGRSKREFHCATYDIFRDKLDYMAPEAGVAQSSRWVSAKANFIKLRSAQEEADKKIEKGAGIPDVYAVGAYNKFKTEWDLYLKPGTSFDQFVKMSYMLGWTATLIMAKAPHQSRLKRIETSNAGGKTKIIWSLS